MIRNNFYKDKRVLITGHTGFKGSWLTLFLHQFGAKLSGISLEPKTGDDFFIVSGIHQYCDSFIHDINDIVFVKEKIKSFQPDLIFHLAAQPLVRYSYNNPLETFQTNVIGTANLLESIKSIKKKCAIVVITTDKVYENREWNYPYRESDRLGGKDPYSASKACAEMVVSSYRNSFFHLDQYEKHQKSIATARAGNVIGGGDWSEDRLIPDIIRAIRNDQEIIVRNPEAVRPWQLVFEPLLGYLKLGEKLYNDPLKFSGEWNFGPYPNEVLTVEEVVKIAIKIIGKGSYKIENDLNAPHEANLLKLDISKALNLLSWKPQLKTYDALSLTMNWYKQYIEDKSNIKSFSIQMMDEYLKR